MTGRCVILRDEGRYSAGVVAGKHERFCMRAGDWDMADERRRRERKLWD